MCNLLRLARRVLGRPGRFKSRTVFTFNVTVLQDFEVDGDPECDELIAIPLPDEDAEDDVA